MLSGKYKEENGQYVLFNGTVEDARPSVLYEKVDGEYVEYKGNRNNIAGKEIYRLNSFGEYVLYTGDVAIAKKAITFNSSDTKKLEDFGWKETAGVWSAYDVIGRKGGQVDSDYSRLYKDKEIERRKEDSSEGEIEAMKRTYVKFKLNHDIVQVGEGQRTETNEDIKKMFLQNKYFRYDGSEETAEAITALRDKLEEKEKYGALTDEECNVSDYLDLDGDGKNDDRNNDGIVDEKDKYSVKEFAGTVLLNQDSLNAFSMLENTHTLDADYIYRDFKELIVELGYFEKEELAEEKPKILQFPIPGIETAGFPNRTIDKREVVEGTMIHSKHDIEANKKYTLNKDVEEPETITYEGFKGNEAVVSPVTGILLDYGTYPISKDVDEDNDGNMDKEERINIDLKYGPSLNTGEGTNSGEGGTEQTQPVDPANPEGNKETEVNEVVDNVGYATIFVLNKESFEMLDAKSNHRWKNVTTPEKNNGEGLLNPKGYFYEMVTTNTEYNNIQSSLLDKTIYGYKEFTEAYEKLGISGYIIHIDGFKCELPDPSFNGASGAKPNGKKLTLDSFKVEETAINNNNQLIQSLYEKPEEFKMASKKATEKLNVEEKIKDEAYFALTIVNPDSYEPLSGLNDLIFIKEGTVLGRTYTDKELVAERVANGDPNGYEYYAPNETVLDENGEVQNNDKIIGNYIFIKMSDPDKTVENVENYMKIDEIKEDETEN